MADKTYRIKFKLSNGTTKELEFTVPQGPQGLRGLQGIPGKSAYQYAQEAGYTGSEEEFAADLTSVSGSMVGDILTTVRTDMDDSWLLCNGDLVSAEDYEELSRLFPQLPDSWAPMDLYRGTANTNHITSIAYANGYWVAVGRYNDGSTNYARIAYTTDPTGTWTVKDLWSGSNSRLTCVTYANGYWVVGGQYYDGSMYYARVAYATTPAGTWTNKDVWSNSTFPGKISCITYANGYWMTGGLYYDGSNFHARIAYATDLTASWTKKDLWSGSISANDIFCITYANGYWVAGGIQRNNTSVASNARIAYATDPSGAWATEDLWYGTASENAIYGVTYADGHWAVAGRYYTNNYNCPRVAHATDLAGTWTNIDLFLSDDMNGTARSIIYVNGYWMVAGQCYDGSDCYARIAYTTDLAGTWTPVDLWSGPSANTAFCVAYTAGQPWATCGQHYDGSHYYAMIAYCNSDMFALPAISSKDTYTYIRAKGG